MSPNKSLWSITILIVIASSYLIFTIIFKRKWRSFLETVFWPLTLGVLNHFISIYMKTHFNSCPARKEDISLKWPGSHSTQKWNPASRSLKQAFTCPPLNAISSWKREGEMHIGKGSEMCIPAYLLISSEKYPHSLEHWLQVYSLCAILLC